MRRQDKLKNMIRVNMLFEQRNNENYGYFDVMDDDELEGVYGDNKNSEDDEDDEGEPTKQQQQV